MKYNWKDLVDYLLGDKKVGTDINVNPTETVLHFKPKQEPVVGELAQQLAEAIRTGKIILEIEEQLLSSIRYKAINGITFVRNVTGIDCNGVFNPDEQRYLLAAHKDWQEEQKRCKRITTEKQIKNLLSSIDK